jgi:putative ABC transport system permease protein
MDHDLSRTMARWLARGYPSAFRQRHAGELLETLTHSISGVRQRRPWMWVPIAAAAGLRDLWRARSGTGSPRAIASAPRGRGPGLSQTIFDVRLAFRRWRTRPALAVTAIATLALGIGSSTAIYSAVDGVLLKPLPWRDSDRLVSVYVARPQWKTHPSLAPVWDKGNLTWGNFVGLSADRTAFEEVAIWQRVPQFLGGSSPAFVQAMRVSSSFLPMLGVTPLRGRIFTASEDDLETDGVIVTYETWQRRLGGTSDIIGHQVLLQSTSRTIIGVLPPGFVFLDLPRAEFLLPMGTLALGEKTRPDNYLANTVGRLRPGVTLEQATQVGTNVIKAAAPKAEARVVPLLEAQVGSAKLALILLMGAAGLLLLIACANVAGLLLGEASGRRHEIAVRAALGGSRRQVARQLWTESLVLTGIAVIAGLAIATALLPALISLAPPGTPRLSNATLDLRVYLFAIAIGALTAVVFGTGPALALSRTGPAFALREGGRTATRGTRRAHRFVVAVQVALTFVLLVGASLMAETVRRLTSVPVGFDPSPLTVVNVRWPETPGQTEAQQQTRLDDILSSLKRLPGVMSAAATMAAPFSGMFSSSSIQIEGRTFEKDPTANRLIVSEDYFDTLGQPARSGRLFKPADRTGEPVAIVTTEFERQLMDGHAVGGRLQFKNRLFRIVGVVDGARQRNYTDELAPTFYLLTSQAASGVAMFVVRTAVEPATVVPDIRQSILRAAPGTAIQEAAPMSVLLDRTIAVERYRALISTAFGAVALLLAALGLYGIVSRFVAERQQEIGIRVALGASRQNVLRLVFQQGLALLGVGLLAGIPAAWISGRMMASSMFGVTPSSVQVFGLVIGVLVSTTCLAMLVPAVRAGKVDPLHAIRQAS